MLSGQRRCVHSPSPDARAAEGLSRSERAWRRMAIEAQMAATAQCFAVAMVQPSFSAQLRLPERVVRVLHQNGDLPQFCGAHQQLCGEGARAAGHYAKQPQGHGAFDLATAHAAKSPHHPLRRGPWAWTP